jgi:hypothetical protein
MKGRTGGTQPGSGIRRPVNGSTSVGRDWDSGEVDMRAHADAWLAAWEARNLDAIMACYAEDTLLTSPGGYALLYRRENGNRVLDVVELDPQGHAIRVHAFYEHLQQ